MNRMRKKEKLKLDDEVAKYTTQEISVLVGMSVSQVHYYDRLGLIPNLRRSENGYRVFTEKNLIWMKNLKIFIDSEMPLKDIRQLTDLVVQGKQATAEKRQAIVEHHLKELEKKQAELKKQVAFMNGFIKTYQQMEKESDER
ncbi:MerR family transcriptional regulator [Lactiplantibacillus plantarum]|uniref:MerR family transcriptional regulator n=1 Tax=Lactiplantibacillus plantarum TaxID=1590 RepID=UPI0031583BB6